MSFCQLRFCQLHKSHDLLFAPLEILYAESVYAHTMDADLQAPFKDSMSCIIS